MGFPASTIAKTKNSQSPQSVIFQGSKANGRYGTFHDDYKPCDNSDLGNSQKFHSAKSLAFGENSTLSPDDRQALATIITLWPELLPEVKIGVLKMVDAATVANVK